MATDAPTPLAQRIRLVLERTGLSESALSQKAGLGRTTINAVLRRQRENPDAEIELGTLRAIARTADVSERWLVHGIGSPDDTAEPEQDVPAYGNALGWKEAEAEHKKMSPGYPAWAYAEARRSRGYVPPGQVTPEFVQKIVQHVMNIVPLEEQARRALAEVDAQAKRLNTRAERKAKRGAPPTSDAGFKLEPPAKSGGRRKRTGGA